MGVKERWARTKPIRGSQEEVLRSVLAILRADKRIEIAYLFGSRTKEEAPEGSDIDIAIFTSKDVTWDDYYRIYGDLTKALHSDRVDLVWLNRADPLLKFAVIKEGMVLFYRDPDALNDFELKAKKEFYDHVIYLKKHRSA